MSVLDREFKDESSDAYPEYHNIYDNPDKCGFDIIATVSEGDLSYAYNRYVLFQDKESKKFFGAGDCGCSCPTPFEDFKRMSDLTYISNCATLEQELKAHFCKQLDNTGYRYKENHSVIRCLKADIESMIKHAREEGLE